MESSPFLKIYTKLTQCSIPIFSTVWFYLLTISGSKVSSGMDYADDAYDAPPIGNINTKYALGCAGFALKNIYASKQNEAKWHLFPFVFEHTKTEPFFCFFLHLIASNFLFCFHKSITLFLLPSETKDNTFLALKEKYHSLSLHISFFASNTQFFLIILLHSFCLESKGPLCCYPFLAAVFNKRPLHSSPIKVGLVLVH
jgi:hypothetical protein